MARLQGSPTLLLPLHAWDRAQGFMPIKEQSSLQPEVTSHLCLTCHQEGTRCPEFESFFALGSQISQAASDVGGVGGSRASPSLAYKMGCSLRLLVVTSLAGRSEVRLRLWFAGVLASRPLTA